MHNTREKLIELIDEADEWADHKCDELECETCPTNKMKPNCVLQLMIDRLIANGVTVQKWIPASKPPTRKDADKYGRILAMEFGMMALVDYRGPINYPNRFPYWLPLPEPPKEVE